MPATYKLAPDVRAIADALIPLYHAHLLDHEVRMEYLFVDPAPRRNRKVIWGTARKISSLAAFLAVPDEEETDAERGEPFFCIVISWPIWRTLADAQRQALVDHELAHCWAEYDDRTPEGEEPRTKLTMLGHDLEEFNAIVERHGIWRRDVEQFAKTTAAAQLTLPVGR